MEAQLSNNETARLKALYKYQILDTEPEEEFNDIARLAAYICKTPIVLINLIDENRQWFKAKIGMDATYFPRDVGLCLLCIQQCDTVVISDTLADQRSKANSVVTCAPYIRFYAGAPLITPDGHIIGTLCVLDYVPRSFSPEQVEALEALSRQVVSQLELRRNLKLAPSITKRERAEDEFHCSEEYLCRILKSSTDCIKVLDLEGRLLSMSYQGQLALEIDDFTPYLKLSWLEFWEEADQEAVCFALATAKAGGVGKFQGYCPTAKGKPKWWDVVITPLMGAKGKPEQLLAVSRDITEYKQAESERERFFRLSLHMLCIGGFDGYFKFLNSAWEKTLGFTKEELLSKPYIEFIHPQDRAATIAEAQKLTSGVETIAFENRYLCKDGSYKWLLWNAAPFTEQKLIYCVVHDITQRKRVEEELCEMNLVLENAVEGISRLDTQGRFITVNRAYADKVGYQPEEMLGMEWQATVYPEERETTFAAYQYMLTTGKVEVETRGVRKDGSVFYQHLVMISAYDKQQQFSGHYGFMKDVSERKQTEAQLWHQACHDALTGLPNRTLFIERLDRAIKRTKRQADYLFAVLFLDLDRFKVVNDSLGHLIGDQLLIAIAHRLEACLRPTDTVARFGGDEFTILLENIKDINHASYIAERIQQELTLPFNLSGHVVFTTASIGITLSTTNSNRPEDILRDADTTMYRAKASGKARCEIFDPTMHSQAMARLQLETDLQWALQRQEFELHYQPIVSLKNDEITGFEALLRWHHPVRGIIAAAEFIPIAEETGLIVPIDWWVLREACQQMRTWQRQFGLNSSITMSVNLSGKQFSQTDFIEEIEKIINDTTINSRSLKLEITESILIENAQSVSAILVKLQALGIRLSIDDFGTGYSSLSYLHQFPIDTIKIDGSFINNVDIDVEKIEIVRTIVGLAWNLGMDVVAEGVETNKQMYQVKALKCDFGQGYLFSRPLNREAVEALIATKMQS
jgi:diguanylate cyclase (GGDEF)-like protein/PAS domain S-box-containing protein